MPLGALKVRRGGSWELHMTPWQECGGMNAVSLSGQSRVLWRRWEIRTNRKRGNTSPQGEPGRVTLNIRSSTGA